MAQNRKSTLDLMAYFNQFVLREKLSLVPEHSLGCSGFFDGAEAMKILFLDIDGVLNSNQSNIYNYQRRKRKDTFTLCPICLSNLDWLVEKVDDLKIVLSSTWRINPGLEKTREILVKEGFKAADAIIGATPNLRVKFSEHPDRYKECMKWLEGKDNITHWVILDDLWVMRDKDHGEDAVKKHFVETQDDVGFDWHALVKTHNLLDGRSTILVGKGMTICDRMPPLQKRPLVVSVRW